MPESSNNKLTGWLILIMAGIFVYLSIDPLLNDTEQFIKIVGGIGVGVAVLILLIMGILSRTLPDVWKEEEDDYYKEDDQEYSEGNWNKGVRELGPNPNSLTGITSSKGTTIGTYKKKKQNENRNKK